MLSRAELEHAAKWLDEHADGSRSDLMIHAPRYELAESARQLAEWLALLSGPVPVGGGEKREAWEAAFRAYYEWRES